MTRPLGKVLRWLGASAAAATLVASAAACTGEGAAEPALCTPKARVFCRCVNLSQDTKQCSDDGTSFAECVRANGLACEGGESEETLGKNLGEEGEPGSFLSTSGDPDEPQTDAAPTPPGPGCGNGRVDPGEACDGTPGCGEDCTEIVQQANADRCPGQTVHVWPGSTALVFGDTRTLADDYSTWRNECATFSNTAPDAAYRVVVHAPGVLNVDLPSSFDGAVVGLTDVCGPPAPPRWGSCDVTRGSYSASRSIDVGAGETLWVIVDGANRAQGGTSTPQTGAYALRLVLN